jgi:isoleucyl-tRNA synthetase
MARGWESKSVEDQVEQQTQNRQEMPGSDGHGLPAEEAARVRQRQVLELERERILDERTSNPIRRAALEAALETIEKQIAQLA